MKTKEEKREYQKRYREKNKDVLLEKERQYRARNKKKILANKRKYYKANKESIKEKKRLYHIKTRDVIWEKNLQYAYEIGVEEYKQMNTRQDGKCAICGDTSCGKRLSVDHNHLTGKVRGLLCSQCNSTIGMARESIEILTNAIEYLKTTNEGEENDI